MALPVKKQNPAQRAVVERTLELKELLGYESDSAFAREQLGRISDGRWSKLHRDVYEGNVEKSIELLRQANNRMEVQLSRQAMQHQMSGTLAEVYYPLPLFRAIEGAVARAMSSKGQNRLVFCSLPTGGGKTHTCEYLRQKYGATVIHAALPSYRKSAMPFYKDLARALGVPVPATAAKAEETVFQALQKRNGGLLCIDEGLNFGGQAIDVLKAILNTTHWSVAFFSTPQHFKNMMAWYWDRADQLLRRAVAIIELDEIKPSDVRPFLEPLSLNGSLKDACSLVAQAANEFGAFDLCHRTAAEMAERGAHEIDDVRQAVLTIRQSLRTTAMCANGAKHAKRGRGK